VLWLQHATLGWVAGRHDSEADVTVRLTRPTLNELIVAGMAGGPGAGAGTGITVDGPRPEALGELFGVLDRPDRNFPIVTP
jgi:alkyl sulfatase BDS1-like metallo-beta-lactamase superfamily hydrolase